jgi:hypothetical protein
MHEAFREYVETLHPSFERLLAMEPVKIPSLPKNAPSECIYLFSEAPIISMLGEHGSCGNV